MLMVSARCCARLPAPAVPSRIRDPQVCFAASMQKPPSLRQLLLAELTVNADRSRICTHSSLKFSANSDSSAWKNYFASQHKQRLRDIQLQLNQLRTGIARGADGGSEIVHRHYLARSCIHSQLG